MVKKPRNKYRKLPNERKEHYYNRVIKMLILTGRTEEEALEKCEEKWRETLNSYIMQEDKFLRDAF